ncbi:MAG TPA: hypothetical protein VK177_07130 [Flavobacteriales bacterium]|nr:hypothetical protein [Flavobacteriales bacterium]
MKNKSLLIATVFAASAVTVNAQDLTSKKGETILPEAGDWAISFDATPFLNYAGQMFSNAGATAPTVGYTNGYPWAIKGKMFKDEKTAYRAGIRLGFGSQNWAGEVAVPQASTATPADYPAEPTMTEDTYKRGYNGIVLSGGLEMRRGKTRLQGYYGGELVFGMMGEKATYTYGNNLSAGDPTTVDPIITVADSYDFGTNLSVTDPFGNAGRQTEWKSSMMVFGLRGFIGAEYFILPKISVGAEYGWGLGFMSMKTSSTVEAQGTAASSGNLAVGTFTEESKTSGFMIDSDIQNSATGVTGASGSLNIIFHF